MKNTRRNYRIYNPNPTEATAEYISNILAEVNRKKIGKLLMAAAAPRKNEEKSAAD